MNVTSKPEVVPTSIDETFLKTWFIKRSLLLLVVFDQRHIRVIQREHLVLESLRTVGHGQSAHPTSSETDYACLIVHLYIIIINKYEDYSIITITSPTLSLTLSLLHIQQDRFQQTIQKDEQKPFPFPLPLPQTS
jgi:hypothetical protein